MRFFFLKEKKITCLNFFSEVQFERGHTSDFKLSSVYSKDHETKTIICCRALCCGAWIVQVASPCRVNCLRKLNARIMSSLKFLEVECVEATIQNEQDLLLRWILLISCCAIAACANEMSSLKFLDRKCRSRQFRMIKSLSSAGLVRWSPRLLKCLLKKQSNKRTNKKKTLIWSIFR